MKQRRCVFCILGIIMCMTFGAASEALSASEVYYLQDDSTFSSRDNVDILANQAPVEYLTDLQYPLDLDGDGSPGLTIAKIAGNNKPDQRVVQYQEWISPALAGEVCISGLGKVFLFSANKDFITSEAGSLQIEIFDQSPQGERSSIAQTVLEEDPWGATGGWEEKLFRFVPASTSSDPDTNFSYYRLGSGHQFVLRATVSGDTSNKELWLTYDTVDYPSRIVFASSDCDNIQPPVESDLDWEISGHNLISGLPGNVGIGSGLPGEKLHVVGNAIVSGTLSSGQIGVDTLNASTVNVTGTTSTGILATGTATVSGSTTTGSLSAGSASITGATSTGSLSTTGQVNTGLLHVRALGSLAPNINSADGKHHVAYFENIGTDNADGIAIKIAKNLTNKSNNFVTFFDGGGNINGRIEGFDNPDDWVAPPDISMINMSDFSLINMVTITGGLEYHHVKTFPGYTLSMPTIAGVGIPNVNIPSKSLDIPNGFSTPSITWTPENIINNNSKTKIDQWLDWAITTGNTSLITKSPFDIALAAYLMVRVPMLNDGGVTYGSKGADYAEWLPKLDTDEIILPGFVVGVRGGKVSKETYGAEQIMAVSESPVVLGNMPPDGEEGEYVKIGFMGQVHVLVWGDVRIGDYIVPSGLNDGTGVAVSPKDIQLNDLPKVLGRAWTESEDYGHKMIKVVIGVKSNEWVEILSRHQRELAALTKEISEMRRDIDEIKALIH